MKEVLQIFYFIKERKLNLYLSKQYMVNIDFIYFLLASTTLSQPTIFFILNNFPV